MRKKFSLLFLIFIIGFVVNFGVCNAYTVCKYKQENGGTVEFSIKPSGEIAKKAHIRSVKMIDGKDRQEVDEWDKIYNWNEIVEGNSGKDWYNKNKDSNPCPPFVAVYDRRASTRIYVGPDKFYLETIISGKLKANLFLGLQGSSGAIPLTSSTPTEEANNSIVPCTDYTDKENCERNSGKDDNRSHACVWNEEYGFCNVNQLTYLQCGDSYDIPEMVPIISSLTVTLLKIGTPIILIIVALVTLVKAIASQKEDEIKKAQSLLVKKIIAAVLVFFVITIVQFVILKVGDDESDSITSCLKCFLNNDCDSVTYYKDGYGNCYNVTDGSKSNCEL